MSDGAIDGLLNRSPGAYKALYQARDSLRIIFGGGGFHKYLLKRSYLKRFRHSWMYTSIPLDDSQCRVSIGRYSYCPDQINVGYVPARGKRYEISIGSFTQASGNLTIILSKAHTPEFVSNSMNNLFLDRRGRDHYERYHKDSYGEVVIGNDVWFGSDVVIIGNVKIGDGAVIGARAVVTKDVEPYSVVVGAPARKVRFRFSKQVIDALLRIKWWDWREDKILSNLKDFYDVEAFVRKHGR
jgi:acetyltransferase-like isoleucine patch superfamily enzyme